MVAASAWRPGRVWELPHLHRLRLPGCLARRRHAGTVAVFRAGADVLLPHAAAPGALWQPAPAGSESTVGAVWGRAGLPAGDRGSTGGGRVDDHADWHDQRVRPAGLAVHGVECRR